MAAAAQQAVPPLLLAIPQLTKLHNRILPSRTDQQAVRAAFSDIFRNDLPAQQAVVKGSSAEVTEFARLLYHLLNDTGRIVPCRHDSTLPATPQSSEKYYIATNLHNNEQLAPHYIASLVRLLLYLPPGHAFVSLYESASQDDTALWVEVFELTAHVLRVPCHVDRHGTLVRGPGQERIPFLARVRNAALQPLYRRFDAAPPSPGHSSQTSMDSQALDFDPDKIIFINDVYFCWQDVVRLQQHNADISCGTDWWQNQDGSWWFGRDGFDSWTERREKPTFPLEISINGGAVGGGGSTSGSVLEDSMPLMFYDIWVSRDIGGAKFSMAYPFVKDRLSAERFKAGLPFRAQCCWNGLAVLSAEPFRRGVRVRAHQPGECSASECTLLCNDYARLGFTRVVVDPSVQLAYLPELAREITQHGIGGVQVTSWATASAAGVAHSETPPPLTQVECCALRPGRPYVDFTADCARQDITATNYTALAMARGEAPSVSDEIPRVTVVHRRPNKRLDGTRRKHITPQRTI